MSISVVWPGTMVTSLVVRVCPAAEMTVRVFLRPKGAGAANSAKGAGPHSGGGPSLVEVQSLGSGGGASSTQLVSWTTSPKVERSTVLTQTLEPAAGCCPLMVAVPFTIPIARSEERRVGKEGRSGIVTNA